MKVLVTGSTSQVGYALAAQLNTTGIEVVGYDIAVPDPTRSSVLTEFVKGDVRDTEQLAQTAAMCTAGIHLAATAGSANAQDILSVNVNGAYNFCLAARRAHFRTSIIASSAPVHLPPGAEDYGPVLRTSMGSDHVYDLSKTLQEEIGRDFHQHGLPLLCLRFGHVVVGEDATTLEGQTLRDETYCRGGWVDIGDVASACAAALQLEPNAGEMEVLNVVGSQTGRVRFDVAATEARLGVELEYGFGEFE